MYNQCTLIGHLGSDVKAKSIGDKMVVNFSLATGISDKHTDWHNIVAWDKTASICAKYLAKGRKVCVVGRITSRKWEDPKTGAKQHITEIVANQVVLLDSAKVADHKVHDPEEEWKKQSEGDFDDMPF